MEIGIDIGGTNFRIGLVNNGELININKVSIKDVFVSEDPLYDLYKYINRYISDIDYKIDSMAIGFPATINKDRTIVLQAPNIKKIENLNVVEYLSAKFDFPIYIDKDVTMCMLYDLNKHHISKDGITTCIYFGTGIGSMTIIDGKIIKGRNGTAGEIGHVCIDGCNEICGCGNVGCAESVVGGNYLVKLINNVFTDCTIDEIFTKHNNHPLIEQYIDRMACLIANVENFLDPDNIVLGGGVLSMNDFPKELLLKQIIYHTRKPSPANNLNIIFSEDDDEKGVLGAAYLARSLSL